MKQLPPELKTPASPAVRALFDAAREEQPSPERLARIARGLPLDAPPAPASGARRRALPRAIWGLAAACALVGLGAAVVVARRPAPRGTPSPSISTPSDWKPSIPTSIASERAPVPSPSVDAPPPTEVPPTSARPANRAIAHRSSAPVPPPALPDALDAGAPGAPPDAGRAAAVGTEDDLLERAAIVLERNPTEALRLADEHRTGFPAGVLSPEREVIAIQALLQLGRDNEARARGARFLEQYPSSPRRPLVEAMIAP
ncbi:Hypothetical protein A7982_04327 [Minicystis rosea]|nr:Hypothetical protein A7982_04327 [Minicystis rosea]